MLRIALLSVFSLAVILTSVWAILALWFQLPWSGAIRAGVVILWTLLVAVLTVCLWSGKPWIAVLIYPAMYVALLVWWGSLEPAHDRDWADDLARITTGAIEGDQATLFDVRNFSWRTEDDYDVRWETRKYNLSRLETVDLITSEWGMPGIAHILVSFGFGNDEFVTFTVEIRRERQETFSAVGGFFKKFELDVLATDESDAVRVRTNIRGEDAHLYSVNMPQEAMRQLFTAYVTEANRLARNARFYHTVTANCTIIVYNMMEQIVDGLPIDYRLFLSSYLPSYVKEVGGLEPLPLDTLRERGNITDRALQAGDADDFSRMIRQGVPGWDMPD
ncbi:MAG TPA: DUF4105 domain-containing protein [Pseudomonas xinjiangensis]|uniref:DUF4105 domain-containing protein n=2 Tax=root TaxID=1 RepID=A0A7V1BLK8_9GAMM|nr:DUF4105 domain-containing protein [Halopseudomonas xinjiangensis]HEC47687.1 DUF4105 domain-containing protein [Halopseudomonas xinjiangensis]